MQVMDAGKVAEFAMPYELLQHEEGHFRSLVNELGDEMKESFIEISKKRYEENKHLYSKGDSIGV